jgi:hypothetical protein
MLDEREERRSRAAWAGRLLVGTGIGAAAGGVVAHWVGLDPDYGLVAGAVAGAAVAIAGRRWKLRRP